MQKRILIISPIPTHPTDAGNRARIVAMVETLRSLDHVVHFAYIEHESGDRDTMRTYWGEKFHLVPYKKKPAPIVRKVVKKAGGLLGICSVHNFAIDDWYDPSINSHIYQLHNRYGFDVVIAEYVFFSKVLNCFGNDVLKIIDTHDVFTDRYQLYTKNNQKPTWFSTSSRQEAKGLNRANIIIAIQDHERRKLTGLSKRRVVTIGHPVEVVAPQNRANSNSILYVGSRNPINVQSVEYFVSKIFARVRKKIPRATLYLAGSVCENIAAQEGVVKLGRVDDLSAAYELADIVVNPMLFGTGLKVKNIEALGFSRPLVTNSVGAEGLERGAGTAFLVAESINEWVETVIDLLRDAERRWSISRSAYEFAVRWNQDIRNNIEQVVQGAACPGKALQHKQSAQAKKTSNGG